MVKNRWNDLDKINSLSGLKNAIICPCPQEISILWRRSKGIKWRKPWHTHTSLQKKRAHMLLAHSQTNALRIYSLWAALYFQRTAVDLKQLINTQSQQAFSSGPESDYRCHETWNLITSTLSFDATSCLQSSANTWLWHLFSSGLSGDGNCHLSECLGKISGHWELWNNLYMQVKGLVFWTFFKQNKSNP